MEPTYTHGDALLVEPVTGSCPIRLGEVVVARHGERLVTHRVVSLRDGVAVTKGDACRNADPPILISQVIGRVTAACRRPGLFTMLRRALRCIRTVQVSPQWREQ